MHLVAAGVISDWPVLMNIILTGKSGDYHGSPRNTHFCDTGLASFSEVKLEFNCKANVMKVLGIKAYFKKSHTVESPFRWLEAVSST